MPHVQMGMVFQVPNSNAQFDLQKEPEYRQITDEMGQ